MKVKHLIGVLVVLGIAGAVVYQVIESQKSTPGERQAMLVAGAALYQKNCASCHGTKLEGQRNWRKQQANGVLPAPPHDKTGHTWHHNDNMLFNYTKFGGAWFAKQAGLRDFKSGMPGFGGTLDDTQIRTILAYIKSTWPEKIRKRQSSMNR